MGANVISLYGKFKLIIIDENCTVNGEYYGYKILSVDGKDSKNRQQRWSSLSQRRQNSTSQSFKRIGQVST